MFAELMARDQTPTADAKETDPIANPRLGMPASASSNATAIAVGAATAAQLRADGSVAVAFFGDGAVAQGTFHEAVNLAVGAAGRLLL